MRDKQSSDTYLVWRNMIRACYCPSSRSYASVGGRGIFICQSWRFSYDNFFQDMGSCKGRKLRRKDRRKDFTKDNCYWV